MKKILNFTKMSGAGNDFIILDAPRGINIKNLAIKVCNRTNGIGADGLLVLDKSRKADFRMRIINADGSEAEMCGNGARCMAAYIHVNKKPNKKQFSMEALAGKILAEVGHKKVSICLSPPVDYKADIPITVHGRKIRINYIDTGVPHAIVFVDCLKKINVKKIGSIIRYHNKFKPRGTNVDFVEQLNRNAIDIRTYERGVEDETMACGTGVVAAAIIAYLKINPEEKNKKQARMKAYTKNKETLDIIFDIKEGKIFNVWLTGSVNFIAKGEYYV